MVLNVVQHFCQADVFAGVAFLYGEHFVDADAQGLNGGFDDVFVDARTPVSRVVFLMQT